MTEPYSISGVVQFGPVAVDLAWGMVAPCGCRVLIGTREDTHEQAVSIEGCELHGGPRRDAPMARLNAWVMGQAGDADPKAIAAQLDLTLAGEDEGSLLDEDNLARRAAAAAAPPPKVEVLTLSCANTVICAAAASFPGPDRELHARVAGWRVVPDGRPFCPNCAAGGAADRATRGWEPGGPR